jgi:hypothetical protein
VSALGWAIAVCVFLAVLSVFVLPSTPSYDPWAWIVWGREIGSGAFTFATNGGPSWKPLPVVFTTVFGLFGGAAPKLWLVAARAGGLLALLGAYRLGWRLAGFVAGVLAAVALLLTHEAQGTPLIIQDWAHYLFRGASEPLLVACVLWAIEAHVAGRRGLAFALGVATSLIRPEAWPFLGVYVIWLWRTWPPMRSPRTLVLIGAGLAIIPLLWFAPPWISTGNPFGASTQAAHYNGQLGSDPLVEVLSRGAHLVMFPVIVFAVVGVVLGWRARDQLTLWLAGGAVAWVALVALMTVAAYPGLGRFMYPPAAVACVLAGAGVGRLGALAAGPSWLRWGVVAVCLGVCVPFAAGRASHAWKEKSEADLAVRFTNQLSDAVGVAGGRGAVVPCPTSVAAVNHTMQTALAWTLHVRLARVKTVLRSPGVNFVGPHVVTIDGAAAAVRIRGGHVARLVARAGVWRVYRVTSPGAPAKCVGA